MHMTFQYIERSNLEKSKLPSANQRFHPLQNPKTLSLLNPNLSLLPIACQTISSQLELKNQDFRIRQEEPLHDPHNFRIRLDRTLWQSP